MQRQEINLYSHFESPRSVSTLLSWERLWLSNAFFVCVFIFMYFSSLWDVYHLHAKNIDLQNQISVLEKKFYAMKKVYPPMFFSQDTASSITKLQQELALQEKILQSMKNHIPFSQELLALSRVIAPNVWLTAFTFDSSGEKLDLNGQSLGMENLQVFINNLVHEKLFAGFAMNVKNIENTSKKDTSNHLSFEIAIEKKTT